MKVCMMLLCEYDCYEYVTREIMIRIWICKLWYSVECFTQDDYVMLISHMKGCDKRKFSSNPKRAHDHVYTVS